MIRGISSAQDEAGLVRSRMEVVGHSGMIKGIRDIRLRRRDATRDKIIQRSSKAIAIKTNICKDKPLGVATQACQMGDRDQSSSPYKVRLRYARSQSHKRNGRNRLLQRQSRTRRSRPWKNGKPRKRQGCTMRCRSRRLWPKTMHSRPFLRRRKRAGQAVRVP